MQAQPQQQPQQQQPQAPMLASMPIFPIKWILQAFDDLLDSKMQAGVLETKRYEALA